jgi:hypothetical protein
MPLQVTRNPEHLSMSRDSNCTKQILLRSLHACIPSALSILGVPQVDFAATNLKDQLWQFPAHRPSSRIGGIP